MEARMKAIYLKSKFRTKQPYDIKITNTLRNYSAKQSALICVDEIINEYICEIFDDDRLDYWKEVKQYLKKETI